ncbi:MAG: MoaD/ThiS family protein [bacterium]|nr:MoaD/ThiS family protein [bacterium]
MKIKLRLFSTLRDQAGFDEKEIETSAPRLVREFFSDYFDDKYLSFVRAAINCEYVSHDTPVCDGDEVAFIPPVSGG